MKIIIQICTAMYLNYSVLSYRHYGFNNSPVRFSSSNFPCCKDHVNQGRRKPVKGANDLLDPEFKIGSVEVPYDASPDLKTRTLALSLVPKLTSKPATNIEENRLAEKSSSLIARGQSQPAKPENVRVKPVKRPVVVIGPMHSPVDRKSAGSEVAAVLRLVLDPANRP